MTEDLISYALKEQREEKKAAKKTAKKPKGLSFKAKGIIALVLSLIIAGGVIYGLEKYAVFRSEYGYQNPIIWRDVVYRLETQPVAAVIVQKKLTEEEVFAQYKLAPLLKTVYFLESTSGKNDSCKSEGKYNGYGYRQNTFEWKCFNSFEEVTEYVNAWYEERLKENGNNIVEAVCYYNSGIAGQKSCKYSDNMIISISKFF